jgi:hypothetical protein
MPSPFDITNIPAPRVDFIDPRTGLMAREWYRFFFNLFNLTGGGSNNTSLADLQVGPPPINDVLGELGLVYDQAQLASMMAQFEEAARNAKNQLDTAPALPQLGTLASVNEDNVRLIGFSTSPSPAVANPPPAGMLYWSSDDATLEFGLEGGVTGQICQQLDFHPKNTGATQINKGMAVMATGVVGSSTKITCARAVADGSVAAEYMLGIAAQNIPVNSFGYVVWFGSVRGFNTTGANKTVPEVWVNGDVLYFDPNYPGELTKVEPSAPDLDLPIAIVTNAANNGAIFVRMKTGESMNELHDVNTATATNGDLLQYYGAGPYWRNVSPSTISIGTATNLAGGAAGSLPYQTGAGATTFRSIGTAAQVLQVNAGATAPEWVSSTGTGNVVRATSATLVTPLLGTPTSGTLTNCTGLPVATGISGLGAGVATFLATPSSANLAAAVTDETGSGALVFGTSPTIATPTFTTSATVPLVIGGTGAAATLALRSTSGVGTTDAIIFQVGNNGTTEAMRILNNGNVGIGTASPGTRLDIANTGAGTKGGEVIIRNSSARQTGNYAQLAFAPNADYTGSVVGAFIQGLAPNANANNPCDLVFGSGLGGAPTERMRIDSAGNVGIGTTSPDALLTVNTIASFGDGAVGAPSIAHKGDLNTGFWFPAADTVAASTSGAERFRIDSSGNVLVTGAGGLGYGTGSGGAVTQATSRTTGVTLDKTNGAITLVSAAGTATWQSFTVTNNKVAATDVVKVCQKSGTDLYMIHVTAIAAGSFRITFATTGGTTTEQPVFNFAIIKAVTS